MLWIYTQDKERLLQVHEVTVKGKKIVGIVRNTSLNEIINLGKYDSTVRAIDVLKEIFLHMQSSENTYAIQFAMPEK